MSAQKAYCRICFTGTKKIFEPISDEVKDNFYFLTKIHLMKSDVYSNVICAQCKRKIRDAKDYCEDLKSNEIRLMGQLQPSDSTPISIEDEQPQADCSSSQHTEIPFIDPSQSLTEGNVKQEKTTSGIKIVDVYESYGVKPPEPAAAVEEPSSDEWPEEIKKLPKKSKPQKDKRIGRIRRPKGAPPLPIGRKRKYQNVELDKEIENLPDTDDRKVNCSRCSKEIFKKYYRQHVERIHLMVKNFFCDICGRKFYSFAAMEEHMNQHLNLKPIKCPHDCGEFFASTTARKNHVKRHHGEFSEIICEFCGSTFKNNHYLKYHILIKHKGYRFECTYPNCTLKYTHENALKAHIENCHEVQTETCNFCNKVFNRGDQMKRHKRYKHSELKYTCKYCGKKFRIKNFLKDHEKRHEGIKDKKCPYCSACYHMTTYLARHIKVVHKKQRFDCEVPGCSSYFVNKDNYRAHIRTVHKNMEMDEIKRILEHITKMKPKFEMKEGEIEVPEEPYEPPKLRKSKRNTLLALK